MVANLSVDHLAAATPVVSSSALYGAVLDRPYDYELARIAIGLTDREYTEALGDVIDGHLTYGPLPHHVDAMAGRKANGRVYALQNVELRGANWGYIIPLRDGAIVYVPTRCGNLSVSRRVPIKTIGWVRARTFGPQLTSGGPSFGYVEGPVPKGGAVVEMPESPVPAPQPARRVGAPWWIAAVGALIGYGVTRDDHSAPSTPVLPCNSGSNEYGGCSR